jgi:hypothetical protein
MIPVVRLLREIIDSCKGGGIIGFVKGREIFCAWLKRWISTVGASFRKPGSPLQKSDAAMKAIAFFHHAGFLIRSMASIMFNEEFIVCVTVFLSPWLLCHVSAISGVLSRFHQVQKHVTSHMTATQHV